MGTGKPHGTGWCYLRRLFAHVRCHLRVLQLWKVSCPEKTQLCDQRLMGRLKRVTSRSYEICFRTDRLIAFYVKSFLYFFWGVASQTNQQDLGNVGSRFCKL